MQAKLFGFLFILAFFTSCTNENNSVESPKTSNKSLLGNWLLADLTERGEKKQAEGEDKLLQKAKQKELVKEGMLLSFFSDGTFTEIKGNGEYKFGKWTPLLGTSKICLSDSAKTDTFSIHFDANVEGRNTVQLFSSDKKNNRSFLFYTDISKDLNEDPYHPSNNVWRIKPYQKENTAQIHERIANYFRHIAYILNKADEQSLNIVSQQFSIGIIKTYNSAVGIYPYDIVPETWKNTYYDQEDAFKAYKMYEQYLRTYPYNGASSGNWTQDDYNILTAMYGDIKNGKFTQ